jgi:thiol-disulfide isomerase/thioredoxin
MGKLPVFRTNQRLPVKYKLTIFLCFIVFIGSSQRVYRVNDKVSDFSFPGVLNNVENISSLGSVKKDIIILDFFGTWCIPCIKALPHLKALQEKFNDQLGILLISNEPKSKLEKFISSRQPFAFPVIVDEENSITFLFAPPVYPYTVVMDKDKNILALTDAESITENKIDEWLAGKKERLIATENATLKAESAAIINLSSSNKLVQLSQQFAYAAKTGDKTDSFTQQLVALTYHDLLSQLSSDDEKKAFWINIYNGYTQALLTQNPDSYKNRRRFFTSRQMTLAGKSFSLDDIEHGILRRSKIKWSLGHLNKLFPGKPEKELRVDELDYRLHFALNCGAKSCPPIAFYNPENIHPQLELATRAYLQSEAEYDANTNTLKLPALMSWFRRDFGGKKKMVQLLKDKNLLPSHVKPKITFKPYDWTLYTDNYKLKPQP